MRISNKGNSLATIDDIMLESDKILRLTLSDILVLKNLNRKTIYYASEPLQEYLYTVIRKTQRKRKFRKIGHKLFLQIMRTLFEVIADEHQLASKDKYVKLALQVAENYNIIFRFDFDALNRKKYYAKRELLENFIVEADKNYVICKESMEKLKNSIIYEKDGFQLVTDSMDLYLTGVFSGSWYAFGEVIFYYIALQQGDISRFIKNPSLKEFICMAKMWQQPMEIRLIDFARYTNSQKILCNLGKTLFREFFINLCLVSLKEKNRWEYADNMDFLEVMEKEASRILECTNISKGTAADNNGLDAYLDSKEDIVKQYEKQNFSLNKNSTFYDIWLKADEAVESFFSQIIHRKINVDVALNKITLRDAIIMMKYSGDKRYIKKVSENVQELLIQADKKGNYRNLNMQGETMLLKVFDVLSPYFLKGIDISGVEQDDFMQEIRIACLETARDLKLPKIFKVADSVDTVDIQIDEKRHIYPCLDGKEYILERDQEKHTIFQKMKNTLCLYADNIIAKHKDYCCHIEKQVFFLDDWDELAVKYTRHTFDYNKVNMGAFIQVEKFLAEIGCILSDREKKIIEWNYGFRDSRPRTTVEVGLRLGVNKYRIEQIRGRALRKLRHRSISRHPERFVARTRNNEIYYILDIKE